MAFFSEEEQHILRNVLPNVAAALRAPLNNLHMAAQRVTDRDGGSDEQAVLQQSYYRMLRLVDNLTTAPELLADTAFDTQNLELVVWLDELCRQADSIAREAGVEVRFVCRERYVIAAVNRTYLERMVWNLLSNALKFTPRGGVITVTLEDKGSLLTLRVRDTGCGIAPEMADTVFDLWQQAERMELPVHGMGLGLLICRRVAEGHGGRLLLESREGEGTLVTVSLPHTRCNDGQVRESRTDYAGGFSHVMMELSDALPYQAFYEKHLDQ